MSRLAATSAWAAAWMLVAVLAWAGPGGADVQPQPSFPAGAVAAQEAQALVARVKSGALAGASDAELLKTFQQLHPEAIASYLELGAAGYPECEITLRRQERLRGRWTAQPFVNLIKYRNQPRQVYMKWLSGGPKAGQEMIYDETKRRDAMYGHLGGLLNLASSWVEVDGSMARDNSNHTVKDLGMQPLAAIFVAERSRYLALGRSPTPDRIEVAEAGGQRTVALTWVAPSGPPAHYAKKTILYLDLRQPVIRQIESWDEQGEQLERILFDKVVPARFSDEDFDPDNKAYAF